ncbi:MAG: serine/threonine-protein kinase, partial [Planctomycetota bacterium]|nr:serine/threonine-protein kinase [Planctomycetota bacterium]
HNKGVIHRDLKPANILIRNHDGAPLITDFGLAKDRDLEALTRTGEVLGTPSYMAPEQFLGEPCSSQTDVWAFAVIAFELLSGGHRPFAAESSLALAQRAMLSEPSSLIGYNKLCSIDVETVIFKALRKKVEDRYESCGEFIEDFGRAARGEAILGQREGLAKRKGRLLYQKLGAVGLLFLCVLLASLIALAVYFSQFGKKAPPKKLVAAIERLKSQRESYPAHFNQHILGLLGSDPWENKLCSKLHGDAQIVSENAKTLAHKRFALQFLPCDPAIQDKLELTRELSDDERALFTTYIFLLQDNFQRAKEALESNESSDWLRSQQLLSLSINYKLNNYSAALPQYKLLNAMNLPKTMSRRLKTYSQLRSLEENTGNAQSMLLLLKNQQAAKNTLFFQDWNELSQWQFKHYFNSGTAEQLYQFHEFHHKLECQFPSINPLKVTKAHLKRMLQLDKNKNLEYRFIHLHYQLQVLDKNYKLPDAYSDYCVDGRISLPRIHTYTLTAHTRKADYSSFLELLLFACRCGIYVDQFNYSEFKKIIIQEQLLEKTYARQGWNPYVKAWLILYKLKLPGERRKTTALIDELLSSNRLTTVYKALLLHRRVEIHYNANGSIHDKEKRAVRERCLSDLMKAFAYGLPNIHKATMHYRFFLSFGLSQSERKAQKAEFLTQLEVFSEACKKLVDSQGPAITQTKDSVYLINSISGDDVEKAKAAIIHERARYHMSIGEHQTAEPLLLSIYKVYPSHSILNALATTLIVNKKTKMIKEELTPFIEETLASLPNEKHKEKLTTILSNLNKYMKARE